jgi:hypothetical protein
MAVSGYLDQPALPCGRLVDDLWEQLDRLGSDPHVSACPYCQTATGSLAPLRRVTGRLADQPVEPPSELTGRIMAVVHSEIRRGRDLTLALPTTAGAASVSEYAIGAVLRFVADRVSGVRARGCRVEPVPDQPGHVWVRLGLAARYGLPLVAVADELRDRLIRAASHHLGLVIDRLDLTIEDVYQEAAEGDDR